MNESAQDAPCESGFRQLCCPMCGRVISTVYVGRNKIFTVKCPECSFAGRINMAYFRRQRRKHFEFRDRR